MARASRKQVADFLKRFKSKEQIQFVERRQCLTAIANLGLTLDAAEDIILSLTEKDYVQGPEKDRLGTEGEVWVFGVEERGTTIYIKLKLDKANAKCLSFHPGSKMDFPYGG